MTSVNSSYAQLARSLHPQLLKFFSRYPPELRIAKSDQETLTTSNTSNVDVDHVALETRNRPKRLQPCQQNPFLPSKTALNGGWLGPKYSLRQQADLYKLAVKQGVDELLPYTPKSLAERTRKREELGLRVKGTGVGQSVKGHVLERYMHEKLEKRKTAMKRMGGLIRFWRLRNRSKGWKDWPKAGRG